MLILSIGSLVALIASGTAVYYNLPNEFATKDEIQIAQAQIADVYDARVKSLVKEQADYEKRLEQGKSLTPSERQRYRDLKEEYERVRQMQKGVRK